MQMKLTIFLIVILFTANIFTMEAQSSENVKVKLITSSIDIHPSGSFWIAAEFEMLNDWHIYWRNSGDSGLPTTISWQLPEGFKVSKTFYPYPQILIEGNSATYIYENKVILFAEVTAPDKIDRDSIVINAKINWLECKGLPARQC
jgi:thiol:disulfide interchange protein DsbD